MVENEFRRGVIEALGGMNAAPERAPRDDDRFVLSPRAALYVAFLDVGHSSDDATTLAEYSLAHPNLLLEDCKPSAARAWAADH